MLCNGCQDTTRVHNPLTTSPDSPCFPKTIPNSRRRRQEGDGLRQMFITAENSTFSNRATRGRVVGEEAWYGPLLVILSLRHAWGVGLDGAVAQTF